MAASTCWSRPTGPRSVYEPRFGTTWLVSVVSVGADAMTRLVPAPALATGLVTQLEHTVAASTAATANVERESALIVCPVLRSRPSDTGAAHNFDRTGSWSCPARAAQPISV